MFRKILIIAMFATAAGYCFAVESLNLPFLRHSSLIDNYYNNLTESVQDLKHT